MKKILLAAILGLTLAGCNNYTKDEMTNIIQQKFPNAVSITVVESGTESKYIWIAKDSNNSVFKISSEDYGRKGTPNEFNPVPVKIIQ